MIDLNLFVGMIINVLIKFEYVEILMFEVLVFVVELYCCFELCCCELM